MPAGSEGSLVGGGAYSVSTGHRDAPGSAVTRNVSNTGSAAQNKYGSETKQNKNYIKIKNTRQVEVIQFAWCYVRVGIFRYVPHILRYLFFKQKVHSAGNLSSSVND